MTVYSYPQKFTSIGGTISYTFALGQMEAQFEQMLRTPLGVGVGADYAHDHLGYAVSPKDPGSIRIRAISVETNPTTLEAEVAEALSECLLIGKGYLYRLNEDSTQQRCLARLRSMPSVTRSGFQDRHQPIMFDFVKLGDWLSTTATTGSSTLTAYESVVTVTNAGNLPVKTGFYFTLTAVASDGWTNPEVRNLANNTYVSTTRDSVRIGDVWKVGDPDYKVSYGLPGLVIGKTGSYIGRGTIGGASYTNDYSLATGTFIRLEPGANQIRVRIEGTPNATFAYSFYGSYA